MSTQPQRRVHRFEASLFPVNAYLIETPSGVIVVDATLGVSDARALRGLADALNKPLLGVIVTHTHPDHYGGLTPLLDGTDVSVYAVAGVNDVTRRDDDAKEQILRPMFGSEWATTRTFPNCIVNEGERVTIGDAVFSVTDLGPGESPHDSLWQLESDRATHVFAADLVYGYMHAYLADGFHDQWLSNLQRAKRELPTDSTLFMGHGQPVTGHALLDWQGSYITRFADVVRSTVERRQLRGDTLVSAVTAEMKTFLPSDDLLLLMQLSVEPMRAKLAAAGV